MVISGCNATIPGPIIDECILTHDPVFYSKLVDDCLKISPATNECFEKALHDSLVADCTKPDKTIYERRGKDLDGMYMYTPEDHEVLLTWGELNCKGAQ